MTTPRIIQACLAVCTLACAASALAQSAGQWKAPEVSYHANCAACHDTGIGPPLRATPYPSDYIQATARHGRLAMPAVLPSVLSDAELLALAQWLRSQPAPAPAPRP